jgi:hypothetical protein
MLPFNLALVIRGLASPRERKKRLAEARKKHWAKRLRRRYHSLKSPADSCVSTTTKKPHDSENRAAFIGHYPKPRRLTTQPLRDQPHANCLRLRKQHARECRV